VKSEKWIKDLNPHPGPLPELGEGALSSSSLWEKAGMKGICRREYRKIIRAHLPCKLLSKINNIIQLVT